MKTARSKITVFEKRWRICCASFSYPFGWYCNVYFLLIESLPAALDEFTDQQLPGQAFKPAAVRLGLKFARIHETLNSFHPFDETLNSFYPFDKLWYSFIIS